MVSLLAKRSSIELTILFFKGENDFLVGGADSKIIAYKFDVKQAKI